MPTQDKLIKKRLSLLELAEFLKNVSEACRINGCSSAGHRSGPGYALLTTTANSPDF